VDDDKKQDVKVQLKGVAVYSLPSTVRSQYQTRRLYTVASHCIYLSEVALVNICTAGIRLIVQIHIDITQALRQQALFIRLKSC
jgi:hypothetical protein